VTSTQEPTVIWTRVNESFSLTPSGPTTCIHMQAALTATPDMFIAKSTPFFILMLNTATLHIPRMFEICCYLNAAGWGDGKELFQAKSRKQKQETQYLKYVPKKSNLICILVFKNCGSERGAWTEPTIWIH